MQDTITAPIATQARISLADYTPATNNPAQIEALRAMRTLAPYLDIYITQDTASITIFEFYNHAHQESAELTVIDSGQVIARTIWEDLDGQARRIVTAGDVDELTTSAGELFDELVDYERRTFPHA